MNLKGVMLGSEQPKVLGEFYTKIFGKPGWQQDDWYGFEVGGGSLMVGPHSEVHGSSQNAERIMIMIEVDDVKKDFDRLKAAGAKVIAEPYAPNKDSGDMLLATLADPDGNFLQLAPPWKE